MIQPAVSYKRHRFPPQIIAHAMAGLYDNPLLQLVVGEVILRRYALSAALGG